MACFYSTNYSDNVPAEFRTHVTEMQTAFSLLDSAVISANEQSENNSGLDPIWIKAVFYALCFGEDAPSARVANRFVECFYTEEKRARTIEIVQEDGTVIEEEETYTVITPLSQESAYSNLAALLERTITDEDRNNIEHTYTMVAGNTGGSSYDGTYLRSDSSSIELDASTFCDPTTKNADDLVTYVIRAWESGWGYVWGTCGNILTESLLEYKMAQYPDGVGK